MRRGVVAMVIGCALALTGCGSPEPPAATSPPAPTFVTPTSAAASSSATPSPAPSASSSPSTPKKVSYTFPVVGKNSYAHTHHDYPASDIITACGNKVVAVTSGTVLAVTRKDVWKASVNAGATRGGLSVSLLGDDGVRYYGSHMSVIDAHVEPGARVSTGQTLGRIGETGDASACHLHFGISPPCSKVGDWWLQRGTVYPWPYLDSWRKDGSRSAVSAVAGWKAEHGCPKKPLVDP